MDLQTVNELLESVEELGRSFQRIHAEAAVSNRTSMLLFEKLLKLRASLLLTAEAKNETEG